MSVHLRQKCGVLGDLKSDLIQGTLSLQHVAPLTHKGGFHPCPRIILSRFESNPVTLMSLEAETKVLLFLGSTQYII